MSQYPPNPRQRPFTRSRNDRMIAGVCRGIADYLNMDPTLVRVAFALLTIFSLGIFGVIAYVALIFVMPEEDAPAQNSEWTPPQPSAEPGPAPWASSVGHRRDDEQGFGSAAGSPVSNPVSEPAGAEPVGSPESDPDKDVLLDDSQTTTGSVNSHDPGEQSPSHEGGDDEDRTTRFR